MPHADHRAHHARARQRAHAQEAQRHHRVAQARLDARKATSRPGATAPNASVCGRAPAVARRLDDGVDAERDRGGHEDRAEHVDALAEADARALSTISARPSTQVTMPIGTLTKKIQCQSIGLGQRRRPAGRSCRRRPTRTCRRSSRWRAPPVRELGGDDGEDDRRAHGAAEALDEAGGDEQVPRLGEAAQRRGDREEHEADEEHAPAADQVAQPAGDEQEAAEGDQVGVDDPGQRRLGEVQVGWIAGRATFTIVASTTIISCPRRTTTRATQRRRAP